MASIKCIVRIFIDINTQTIVVRHHSPTVHSSIPYKLWIPPFLFIIPILQRTQYSDSVSAVSYRSVVPSLIECDIYRVFQKELYNSRWRYWVLRAWKVLCIWTCSKSSSFQCSYQLCLQMSLNSELELLPQLQKWRQRCYVACGKRVTTGGTSAALPMEVTLNHNYPR